MVMLVDNDVRADSRVQKAARSAAEQGWDTTLLGVTTGTPQTWSIGAATVRLLPMTKVLDKRRHEFRRRWLLMPFAYPPTGIAAQRAQAVRAWQADLAVRRAALGRSPGLPARLSLAGQRRLARVVGGWVSFRAWGLVSAQKVRRRLNTPWDRGYTAFWRAVRGDRAWRRLEPGLWDYELAYGPVIDELAPHIIHSHDFRMLGVAARAKARAAAAGRPLKVVWDAHEYLPGLSPWRDNARWLPAHVGYEREYARHADAVVTVSAALADLLQHRHELRERPFVVLNAPDLAPSGDAVPPDLRAVCAVPGGVPLLVYSGVAAAKRGLDVLVDALPALPEAHVAIVTDKPDSAYLLGLRAKAVAAGVADRLHYAPYVPHDQVAAYLAGADLGVIPILHYPNHELNLITKFFEYSHARLPIVVSDVKAMADMVRRTGQGEVFAAGDAAGFVRAVRAVLADPERYRAAYDEPGLLAGWAWAAQAEVLRQVYDRLVPQPATTVPAGIGPD
jgi:glycosyltransferase involved in cell wall biosynthesis